MALTMVKVRRAVGGIYVEHPDTETLVRGFCPCVTPLEPPEAEDRHWRKLVKALTL